MYCKNFSCHSWFNTINWLKYFKSISLKAFDTKWAHNGNKNALINICAFRHIISMCSSKSWISLFYAWIFLLPNDLSRYILSVQFVPFHPGWHPRSQSPDFLLQLLQLVGHSRAQFSPKYPSWHSKKMKKKINKTVHANSTEEQSGLS